MDTLQFHRILGRGVLLGILAVAGATFAAPNTMTYQGTIVGPGGDPIANSAYPMGFSIWDAPSGGARLWEETGHIVSVANGAFAVELGLTTPVGSIFNGVTPRWLEIAADLGAGMQTFFPRVPLTGVPWAMKADNATNADNATHATNADDATHATSADNAINADNAAHAASADDATHATNADNAGNADTVDGSHASSFAPVAHAHSGADITSGKVGNTYLNTGTGNGLDADQVDGLHSSDLVKAHTGAIYRWATFCTYNEAIGWAFNNDSVFFGGVNPSNWSDGAAQASQMSSDKEVLRTLFTRKGYAGKNAMVMSETYLMYSSTNGKIALSLFRIKNTTGSAITWTPQFYYTCYANWSERASVALNGASAWTSGASNVGGTVLSVLPLSIPPSRNSTVIFVVPSGPTASAGTNLTIRSVLFAFTNDSLQLPAGLEYLDDLDTATGGWEQ